MAEGPNVGKGDEEGKEDKEDSEKEEGEWEPPAEEVCTSCQASLMREVQPCRISGAGCSIPETMPQT